MKNTLFHLITGILSLALVGFLFHSWLTMPEIYMSTQTRECVRIIDHKGNEHRCPLVGEPRGRVVWIQ